MKFSKLITLLYSEFKKENPGIKSNEEFLSFLKSKHPGFSISRSKFSRIKKGQGSYEELDQLVEALTGDISEEDFMKTFKLIQEIKK